MGSPHPPIRREIPRPGSYDGRRASLPGGGRAGHADCDCFGMRSDFPVPVRAGAIIALGLAGVLLLWLHGPIPQDPAYHCFADDRTFLGIPNFWNVLTNLPFVVGGAIGLHWLRRAGDAAQGIRTPLFVFFAGVLLTGIGSAYYHWAPTSDTLFWDRLPLTFAFMSLFTLAIHDRLGERAGRAVFWPLFVIGPATILWWGLTDDLRWYAMAQFFPMLAIPLLLGLFPGRRFQTGHWWVVAAFYAMAKATELADHDLHLALGFSGHAIKHLLAACAPVAVWQMAKRAGAIRSGAEAAPAIAPPPAAAAG